MKGVRPSSGTKRWGALVILGMGVILMIAFAAWLAKPVTVQANGTDMTIFDATYNTANTRLSSCDTCHTTSRPALNPYGQAYKAKGRNAGALATIEPTDSDGDGFTNIQEIHALTFPGNPNDHPVVASTPTPKPTATSHPTSVPTGTKQPTPVPTVGGAPQYRFFLPLVDH